jgi:hypothetical protein
LVLSPRARKPRDQACGDKRGRLEKERKAGEKNNPELSRRVRIQLNALHVAILLFQITEQES